MIRPLGAADAAAFQALRLEGLRESPHAFGGTVEEERDRPLETVAKSLARGGSGVDVVFGWWDGDTLAGVAGMHRQTHRKARHRGGIWGMYVTPEARGRSVGRALLEDVIAHARSVDGLHRLELGVEATNAAARGLYGRIGFVSYGVRPDAYRADGRSWDSGRMTLELREAR